MFPASKAGVLRQAAVEDATQLIQPLEIEEPKEDDIDTIAILREVTANVDPMLGKAISIAAKYAGSGDVITNITTSEKARVLLDDYIAKGYTGPSPVERTWGKNIDNVNTSGEGRIQVGISYGGPSPFD